MATDVTTITLAADREIQAAVLLRVLNERAVQDTLWGPAPRLDHDFGRWLQILMEEIGEASKADLEGTYDWKRDEWEQADIHQEDVDHELAQAAAVIVAWLEHRAGIRGHQA